MNCTLILKSIDGNFRRISWGSLPPEYLEPVPRRITEILADLERPPIGALAIKRPSVRRWRLVDKVNTGKRWVGYYELMPEGN